MNRRKRGIVLIIGLIAVLVISVFAAALFFKVSNESRSAKKFQDSTRAFWLAEAGADRARTMLANVSGNILDVNHQYSATCVQRGTTAYYDISSTGTVVASGGNISRIINMLLKVATINSALFTNAITTQGDLNYKDKLISGPIEQNVENLSWNDYFPNITELEMQSYATNTYSNPPNDVTPVSGITWVEGSFGAKSNNWSGTGILIINGDARFEGGTFNGILYVNGKLDVIGNAVITGAVIVKSGADVDTDVNGTPFIDFDSDTIANVCNAAFSGIVSWKEESTGS